MKEPFSKDVEMNGDSFVEIISQKMSQFKEWRIQKPNSWSQRITISQLPLSMTKEEVYDTISQLCEIKSPVTPLFYADEEFPGLRNGNGN